MQVHFENVSHLADRCAFCKANLIGIAYWQCSATMSRYCEGCWQFQSCATTHPPGCAAHIDGSKRG